MNLRSEPTIVELSPWKRQGLFYVSTLIYRNSYVTGKYTRKLDLVSYHLIRLIHGEEKLREISSTIPIY